MLMTDQLILRMADIMNLIVGPKIKPEDKTDRSSKERIILDRRKELLYLRAVFTRKGKERWRL